MFQLNTIVPMKFKYNERVSVSTKQLCPGVHQSTGTQSQFLQDKYRICKLAILSQYVYLISEWLSN